MDDITRRQITWILLAAAAVCLILYGAAQSAVIPNALEQLSTGTLPQQLAAAQLLVDRGKVAEALDGQPRWVQVAAVNALLTLGTPEALQQLVEATPKLDEPVVAFAGKGLASLGRLAIGPLVECIQHKDGKVRSAAEGPLQKIGGKEVIVALTPMLGAYDDYVRASITKIFATLPDLAAPIAVQTMLRETPGPDQSSAAFARAQAEALEILVAMGKPALAPVQERFVPSKSERLRANAALILGRLVGGLKEEAPLVIPPLLTLSRDPAWAVRRRAAAALGELGPAGERPEVLGALTALLKDAPEVKAAAVRSLGAIGSLQAAPALASVMATSRQGAAAELIAAFRALGPSALPALGPALSAADPGARELATQTVAAIGTPAAAPVLAARLADVDTQVRRVAAQALETLATPAVIGPLASALSDPDAQVYTSARRALTTLGAPAVPALVARLGAEPRTALQAEEALATIGQPAVAPLVAALSSANASVRTWAAAALGDIGAEAVAPVAALVTNPAASAPARAAAAEALGLTRLPAALPALQQLVASSDPALRISALRALARSQQPQATADLVAALKDPSPQVRLVALELNAKWQAGDVDKQLADLVSSGSGATQRLAAIALAFHASPTGTQQLPGAVLGTPAAAAGRDLGGLLNAAAADAAEPAAVRAAAVEAMAFAGNAESVGVLLDFLTPGDPLAPRAARALGTLGERLSRGPDTQAATTAAAQLLTVLQTTPSDSLRVQVGVGLVLMQSAAVQPLITALRTAPDTLAPWIVAILGSIGKPAVDATMREAGRGQADRKWAAVALSLTGSSDADRYLARLDEAERPAPEALAAGQACFRQIAAARRPTFS